MSEFITNLVRKKVEDAVSESLGDAYDCLKVWSAWSYGTMSQDDFSLISEDGDRVYEIADAAIHSISEAVDEYKEYLEAAYRAELDKLSQRNYELNLRNKELEYKLKNQVS